MKEILQIILGIVLWIIGAVCILGLYITAAAAEFFKDITEGTGEHQKD